jgi:hypothetical protein
MQKWFRGCGLFLGGLLAIAPTLPTLTARKAKNGITHDELVRRTQELFKNLAAGDQTPWKKNFAEDCMYFDAKGRNMKKAALVADITPLPTGYSGTIKVVKPQSHMERNVRIMSRDMDETETVFGQDMSAPSRHRHLDETQWTIDAFIERRNNEDVIWKKVQ